MKTTKSLFIAAAITGALAAAFPLNTRADSPAPSPSPAADKQGCNGKGQSGSLKEKEGCQGKGREMKTEKKAPEKEKSACAGKNGCGGKDKQS